MAKTEGIYVCAFSTGTVKVGRGSNVESRIAAHVSAGKCFGAVVVERMVFPCLGTVAAERELIKWCTKNSISCICREWFTGIDLQKCREEAQKIALRHQQKQASKDKRIFEGLNLHFGKSANKFSREGAAYNEWRKIAIRDGLVSKESLASMDSLHILCESIRKATLLNEKSPEWFENLNCMQSWEIDLMFCEGVPDEALVADINLAFAGIKNSVTGVVS